MVTKINVSRLKIGWETPAKTNIGRNLGENTGSVQLKNLAEHVHDLIVKERKIFVRGKMKL